MEAEINVVGLVSDYLGLHVDEVLDGREEPE